MVRPTEGALSHNIRGIACPTAEKQSIEIIGAFSGLSNPDHTLENENAVSGATDHGVNSNVKVDNLHLKEYATRAEAARLLCLAIADCHPSDACTIMAAALADLGAGQPLPAFIDYDTEANDWTALAPLPEQLAYFKSIWRRLPVDLRNRFAEWCAQGRRAHA